MCSSDLPALKDECAETQFIALAAAVEDLLSGQSVPAYLSVTFAYTAVKAVIFAIVGKFDQPADVDVTSVMSLTFFPCQCKQVLGQFFAASVDKRDPFLPGQGRSAVQFVNEKFQLFHGISDLDSRKCSVRRRGRFRHAGRTGAEKKPDTFGVRFQRGRAPLSMLYIVIMAYI